MLLYYPGIYITKMIDRYILYTEINEQNHIFYFQNEETRAFDAY